MGFSSRRVDTAHRCCPVWWAVPTLLLAASAAAADSLPAGAIARLGTARFANIGRVFAVAFSPDSKTLAAASWDGDIRLWDVAKRSEIRRLTGHDEPVFALRFTPDGKRLLSAGRDGSVRLWDVAGGKEVRRWRGAKGGVSALLSADGTKFASWHWRRGQALTVEIWDVLSNKELRKLTLGADERPMALSRDHTRLATVVWPWPLRMREPSIHIWDLTTGKEAQPPMPAERGWFTAAFSPDGYTLAIASHRSLRLTELLTGKDRSLIAQAPESTRVVFSADGHLLVSSGGANRIRVWEVMTSQELRRFENPVPGEFGLALSPDGRYLASGGLDVEVMVWDLTGMAQRETPRVRPDELPALWNDLASADAGRAYRALWRLVTAGDGCADYLGRQLTPVRPADPERVARLFTALDDKQFDAREKATRELEAMGDALIPLLRAKLAERLPSLELRRRLERLLEKTTELTPKTCRELRAVETLERIGTPQARKVLQALAKGVPEARLTHEAKAALERLRHRG